MYKKRDNPDVSVIIPVYNDEKYIGEAIDSVCKQKNISLEIICINDGSTDNSEEIIRNRIVDDKRIRLVSQQNMGPGVARNVGIKEAQGKYISFLDSDDYYYDEYALSILVNLCEKEEILVSSGKMLSNENGNVFPISLPYELKDVIYDGRIYKYIDLQISTGFTCCVYSKNLIINKKLYFGNNIRYEDPPWFVKVLFYAERIAFCDTNLYCVRRRMKDDRDCSEISVEANISGIREVIEFAARHDLKSLIHSQVGVIDADLNLLIKKNINIKILNNLMEINKILNVKTVTEILNIIRNDARKHEDLETRLFNLFTSYKNIYIYGAGKTTLRLLKYIKLLKLINKVRGIVVTDKEKNPIDVMGIKVTTVDDVDLSQDNLIIITIRGEYYYEVIQKLSSRECIKYVSLNHDDREFLKNMYYGISEDTRK